MKLLPTYILFLCSMTLFAQEVDRVEVRGIITAPVGEDIEEISIYNISSQKGAVSDSNGEFKLQVAENDRVRVTALQFKSFTVVINSEDIEKKELSIYMNPIVNRLGEVIVRNTDLTGVVDVDAKNIETSVFMAKWDLSYAALEYGYNFERDEQSAIVGNAAEEALGQINNNQASVDLTALSRLIFQRKKKSPRELAEYTDNLTRELLRRHPVNYLVNTFEIPQDKVNDFVYFTEENGLNSYLLKPENEIQLLEFLFDQSEAYKKQLDTKD
ncbi:MAG: carboxypeptidase-like regulatory domain-containing protein [Bacteroidota bacterium]